MTRGNINDLVLPVGFIPPRTMAPLLSGFAGGMREATEIVEMFGRGRDYKPREPIMLVGPDGHTPIVLLCEGDVEASELQDMAMEAISNQEERVSEHGRGIDYDMLREKSGLPRHEDAPMAIKDALAARIAHHKQNPVTDPFRQPRAEPRPPQFALGGLDKEGAA